MLYRQHVINFPAAYPIKIIYFNSLRETTKRGAQKDYVNLDIEAKNAFLLEHLYTLIRPLKQKLLPDVRTFHDDCYENKNNILNPANPNNTYVPIVFSLQKDSPETIFRIIAHVIDQLETLSDSNGKPLSLMHTRMQLKEYTLEYFNDYHSGYPELPPKQKKRAPEKCLPMKHDTIENFLDAVSNGNAPVVYDFLFNKKISPQLSVYGCPIYAHALPKEREQRDPQALLLINSYFLQSNVNFLIGPDEEPEYDSALRRLIASTIDTKDKNLISLAKEYLRMMLFLYDEPVFFIPSNFLSDKDSFAYFLHNSLRFKHDALTIPYKISACRILSQKEYHFTMKDSSLVTTKTYPVNYVLQDPIALEILFDLFQRNFSWKGRITEDQLRKYFYDLISDNANETTMEIIKKNGQHHGLIVRREITKEDQGKTFSIYHCKLAVADKEITQYDGLLNFLSHKNGFIPRLKGVTEDNLSIISVFEAASLASYLALIQLGLVFDFNLVVKWFSPLKKHVYPNDPITALTEGQYWYQPDSLSFFQNNSLNPTVSKKSNGELNYPRKTAYAAERFSKTIAKPGHCVVIAYENNSHNLGIFKKFAKQAIEKIESRTTEKKPVSSKL